MIFDVGCSLTYRLETPVPFLFNVGVAARGPHRVERETLSFEPDCRVESWTMPESGNRYVRVHAQPGRLRAEYSARVSADPGQEAPEAVGEIPGGELPLSVLTHLYPSRYCQSDRLERFAKGTFGNLPAGYERVNGICNWIHDNVEYQSGASDALTSAFDTVTQRAGVCRDFAHLAIALCRAHGIPARYVSAYAWKLDPPDFHAVVEAFLLGPSGPGWYIFDPTRMSDPRGLVRIGVGRDAAEVAFCTPFGAVEYDKPDVWIRAEGDTGGGDPPISAIRTEG